MSWIKDILKNWLDIREPDPISVTIQKPWNHEMTVFRNELWYQGDPSELHQFYTQIDDNMANTTFWSAIATTGVNFRKIHSGLPALIVDVLVNIVVADLTDITIDSTEAQKRWDEIAEDNNFTELLKEAIKDVLVSGDGAFKISYDPDLSEYPLIEFNSGTKVKYCYNRSRLTEIKFISKYKDKRARKEFILEESYSKTGITYALYDERGNEIDLNVVPELAELTTVINEDKFIMAVPLMFKRSPHHKGRGKSLFEGKSGAFDAFDECVSQWVESMRDARSNKYIPETLLPKNPHTGEILQPNAFDNRYVKTGADLSEDSKNEIKVIHGDIPHDALVNTYITLLDLCLQGLVSPSTLGIDVKKLDNAEAQREKEKTTLYTRNNIVDTLEKVIPQLVEVVLKTDDKLNNRVAGEYKVTVTFGEYANPSFEAQVETIGKAKQYGIMSIERVVEELYGDSWTDEEKAVEVQRLKDEGGVVEMPMRTPEEELGGGVEDVAAGQRQGLPSGEEDSTGDTESGA